MLCTIALVAVSCGHAGKGRIIPRGKMSKIYAKMLITDQWISDHNLYHQADTSLVYEPIIRSFGYNADDYRASLAYYMEDPARYEKMLIRAREILEARLNELKIQQAELDARNGKEPYYLNARYDKSIFIPVVSDAWALRCDTLRLFHDTLALNITRDLAHLSDTLSVCYHPVVEDVDIEVEADEAGINDSEEPELVEDAVDTSAMNRIPPDALDVLQDDETVPPVKVSEPVKESGSDTSRVRRVRPMKINNR